MMYSHTQLLAFLNLATTLCARLGELSEDYWDIAFDADPDQATLRMECAVFDAPLMERELRTYRDAVLTVEAPPAGENDDEEALWHFTLSCPWATILPAA